jgi:dienelactone hydrolase
VKTPAFLVATALLVAAPGAQAFFGRADFPSADEPFTEQAVVRGIRASQAQCEAQPGTVWAQPPGSDGECLRYWHAGLDGAAPRNALFFFSGDLLAGNTVFKGYAGQTVATIQKTIDTVPARYGVPYVFIGRPGTYGSSGEHKQRRRVLESRLVSAAMDEIKKRHQLQDIAVAGQSGGGHVVASLLAYRSDIVCAVPASAVSSPSMRMKMRGWSVDATGYADSHEPAEHLDKARAHPALRVFVVGDPQDSNVPWAVQTFLADRLRAVGLKAEVLEGEGVGPERHGMLQSALLVGSMCLKGLSTDEIRQRAAQGLKG